VAAAAAAGRRPDAVLIDARVEGAYGGTGACADWRLLSDYPAYLGDTPLILAGGLTADNVAEAIARVRPAAVDTASGVESSPGQKKPELVRAFVEQSQAAFSLVR
jgi:phosphoribosylanthranilate isomerase